MKITVSENLLALAKKLKKYAPLYIVGGYVRNSLLGITPSDVDLASKLTPERLSEILAGSKFEVKEISKKLGTITIRCGKEIWEHTTFRRDNYDSTGRHVPKNVDFVEDVREDAKRRDFTVNAIYYNILKDELVDVYSGVYDLQKHILKCVETPNFVFNSDGLRILRMVRFACELNFKIDRATLLMARKMSYRLNDIVGSRKFTELYNILNSPTKYSVSNKNADMRGLNYLNFLHAWPFLYVHSTYVRYRMTKNAKGETKFYSLLIDIINSVNPDCIEFYLKYLLGQDGFMLPKANIENITKIICGYYDALNKMNNKKYFFKYFNYFPKIAELLKLKSKFLYNKYYFFDYYIKKHKIPIHIKDLKIKGEDLKKIKALPAKKYSIVLNDLLDKVFDGLSNDKETLLKEVEDGIANNLY